MSERRPRVKLRVQIEMPRMVRNWRCQPKESFWVGLGWVEDGVGRGTDELIWVVDEAGFDVS